MFIYEYLFQGLAKLMRHCGIDTVMLDNYEDHDNCIDYYEKEKRIILTRGGAYDRLRKFVPASHIYHVKQEVSI